MVLSLTSWEWQRPVLSFMETPLKNDPWWTTRLKLFFLHLNQSLTLQRTCRKVNEQSRRTNQIAKQNRQSCRYIPRQAIQPNVPAHKYIPRENMRPFFGDKVRILIELQKCSLGITWCIKDVRKDPNRCGGFGTTRGDTRYHNKQMDQTAQCNDLPTSHNLFG